MSKKKSYNFEQENFNIKNTDYKEYKKSNMPTAPANESESDTDTSFSKYDTKPKRLNSTLKNEEPIEMATFRPYSKAPKQLTKKQRNSQIDDDDGTYMYVDPDMLTKLAEVQALNISTKNEKRATQFPSVSNANEEAIIKSCKKAIQDYFVENPKLFKNETNSDSKALEVATSGYFFNKLFSNFGSTFLFLTTIATCLVNFVATIGINKQNVKDLYWILLVVSIGIAVILCLTIAIIYYKLLKLLFSKQLVQSTTPSTNESAAATTAATNRIALNKQKIARLNTVFYVLVIALFLVTFSANGLFYYYQYSLNKNNSNSSSSSTITPTGK